MKKYKIEQRWNTTFFPWIRDTNPWLEHATFESNKDAEDYLAKVPPQHPDAYLPYEYRIVVIEE